LRGGVTPFNLLPLSPADAVHSAGARGHGAGTPAELCNWWLRYITPPGGTTCDPFMGSGTTGQEAVKLGYGYIGIERDAGYFATACDVVTAARQVVPAPVQAALAGVA
jgi:hypothetical protein